MLGDHNMYNTFVLYIETRTQEQQLNGTRNSTSMPFLTWSASLTGTGSMPSVSLKEKAKGIALLTKLLQPTAILTTEK